MTFLTRLQYPNVQPASLILLFGLLLVIVPNFSHLPLWLNIVTTLLLFWRACHELQLCGVPNKFILFLLTLMLIAGIFFSYRTLIGRDAGSALLLGLLCLKLFEIKTFRDVALIINLALFSVVVNFLFNQSIPVALTMLFALVFLIAALISYQHNYKELSNIKPFPTPLIHSNEKKHFQLAFKMLVQAAPLAIVLFILFPRVDGPLWGLPEDAFSGKTGLSDKMSPGRISKLSDDDSVAFRVKFESPIPTPDKLYWRGPVLWHFNSYDWTTPNNERIAISSFKFSGIGNKTNYSVTLQPHNSYWLFALDIPSTRPKRSRFSSNMQLVSMSPVQKLKRYELSSYTKYILPTYSSITIDRYLKLPNAPSNDPTSNLYKSRKLMERLIAPNDPRQTVNNVLDYFATQNFYYSRTPPLLYNNPIDEFLFNTKRGYCEHYASSFAVLMRIAGIPSRVVTGYQGGEINPIDGYMTIRQSDAHAWTEVFLGKKGWVRIDPTAAIPPENIENTNDAQRLNSSLKKPSYIFKKSWLSEQMKRSRFAWDAINNRWNQWVLGYNNKRQKAFFAALGIPEISWQGLSQLLFGILTILTSLLAFVIFSKKHTETNKTLILYQKFLKKLAKHNLSKDASEGAYSFALRAAKVLPSKVNVIYTITDLYQELRYHSFNQDKLLLFKNAISNFEKS